MQGFKFPKQEKIVSKYDVELLFGRARSAREGAITLRFVWREAKPDEPKVKVLIVVPKKRIRLAVKRNRVKRQIREIYRNNKIEPKERTYNKTLLIAVMYQSYEMPEFQSLKENFLVAAKALLTKIDKA